MKIRLVRTSSAREGARYAVLYSDGTMVRDLNFSRPRVEADAVVADRDELRKKQARDCRILKDIFVYFKEYRTLSALNYGVTDRWDTSTECANMSLWGYNYRKTEAFVSDNSKLCVYNPALFDYIQKASEEEYPREEHDEVKANTLPLKFKVVKKRRTLRDDLIFLWPNGVKQKTGISRVKYEGADLLASVMRDFKNPEKYCPAFSKEFTRSRWSDDFGLDAELETYSTVLAITGDNKACILDNALFSVLRDAVHSNGTVTKANGMSFVTPIQYAYISYLCGIHDAKMPAFWTTKEAKREGSFDSDKDFRAKMNNIRVRVMSVLRKSRDGEFSGRVGFPFARTTEMSQSSVGKTDWRIPVYYPGDPEYELCKGDGIHPCLPPYPVIVSEPENYEPIIITDEVLAAFERYLRDYNTVQKNSGNTTDDDNSKNAGVYATTARIYEQNCKLIDRINEIKAHGYNPKEIAEALLEEHYGTRTADTEEGQKAQAERFAKTVERRWGSAPERNELVSNQLGNNQSFAEIGEELGFTPGFVYRILCTLVSRKNCQGSRYLVGEQALNSCTEGILKDYHEYNLVSPSVKRLCALERKNPEGAEAEYEVVANETGLSAERVKEIVRALEI